MNYSGIKKFDIANGEGVRVSLFVSGCRNHCKNCFNKETWDFSFGNAFTEDTENELLKALEPDYISGLSVLGGDPFEEENQLALVGFLAKVKQKYPHKTIWCYTGYLYDKDLKTGGKKYCKVTDEMLSYIDILVDGPFITELKDLSLPYRGSSNQRIITINK